jgi:hypothetical protein
LSIGRQSATIGELLFAPTEVNQLLRLRVLDKIGVGSLKQHRSFRVANIFRIDAIPLKYNALSTRIPRPESLYFAYSVPIELSGAGHPKNAIGKQLLSRSGKPHFRANPTLAVPPDRAVQIHPFGASTLRLFLELHP